MNSRKYKFLGSIVLVLLVQFSSYGQKKNDKEKEINFVWVDTIVTIDDSEVRIVSNDITTISCCMKSPKYTRVSAKAIKWIRKTYDPDYEGIPFKTLQNKELALTVIEAAKEKSGDDSGIKMVDYDYKCD